MSEEIRKMLKAKANLPAVVYILPEVKSRLDTYAKLAKGEISCLGMVKKIGRGELLVEEVFLFSQKCDMSDTNLNLSEVSDFIADMIMTDKDPSRLRLWWHSHANMNPFWSVQDNTTISGFNNEWMVSIVTNFKGEYMCRVDVFQPIQTTAYDIPVQIYLEVDDDLLVALKNEVDEKVKFIEPKKNVYKKNPAGYVPPGAVIQREDYPPVTNFYEDLNLGSFQEGGVDEPVETAGNNTP